MNKEKLKELIDLIVEKNLNEDDGGGDYGGPGGGSGIDIASYGTYTQPGIFRDIGAAIGRRFSTAAAATSGIIRGAITSIKGLFYIIPTILIPGLEFNYKLFKKDEEQKMKEIKEKYRDVLAANWEALKDPDVFGFLFLAYPQAMLGYSVLKRSPLAVLNLLEMLTGGNKTISSFRARLASSAAYRARTTPPGTPPSGGAYGDYYDDNWGVDFAESAFHNGKLVEAVPQQQQQQQDPNQQIINQIWAYIQTPQVKKNISESPLFKDMQKAAVDIMTAPVKRFMKVENFDQMSEFINQDAIKKAKEELAKNKEYQKADQKTKTAIKSNLLNITKKAYKNAFVSNLEKLAQSYPFAKQAINLAIYQINNMI